MKVLVVVGVYSGLAESLATGCWRPRGVPAVYRLLEGLAARQGLSPSYVFLSRDFDARFSVMKRIEIAPLGDRIWISPWRHWPLFDCLKLGNMLREMEQALRVLVIAMRLRPDVAYCTNAGFVAASLLARFRIAPVVLRFLGIFPVHKQMAEGRSRPVARWLYRAPFARVICTLEGSGAEYYLPKLLRPGVPCDVVLNGVDRHTANGAAVVALRTRLARDGAPIIGFVGRLEPFKGCEDFVEALIALQERYSRAFTGLIVGDGPLKQRIAARVAEAGLASRIVLTGALPHEEAAQYFAAMDIYVSLNRYGNLSNANLEAMIAGRCMLVLAGEPREHIDEITEQLLPPSIVERIPRGGTAAALADTLARLISDPAEISRRGQATAALAKALVTCWNERIEREIATILSAGKVDRAAPQFHIEKRQ